VALTRNHLLACVTCFDGNFTFRRLALPVTVPLHELLPYVARKLHVQELEDFEFLVEGSSAGTSHHHAQTLDDNDVGATD